MREKITLHFKAEYGHYLYAIFNRDFLKRTDEYASKIAQLGKTQK